MTAAPVPPPEDSPEDTAEGSPEDGDEPGGRGLTFDRHLVLDQLGGWRGMVDASLPTIAFILANALGGLEVGIWWALGTALVLFLLRLVRRENVQQAVSGLIGVAVAVGIAAASGQARDFFVLGIVRNAAIGLVLLGSVPLRRPVIGYIAEFLAPSHLGTMASPPLPGLRGRLSAARRPDPVSDAPDGTRPADPEPERHWRDDPRMVRAYGWLTVVWAVTFLLRVAVQTPLYYRDDVALLGTASLVLGLPVTAVALLVTLYVVARLHRHRIGTEPGTDPA